MKVSFVFALLITTVSFSYAQTDYLRIGQDASDVEINGMTNYQDSKVKIADLRGRLIILDFWSTGCSSCIAGFPKMEQLQDRFDGKVQIILVNPMETKTQADAHLKRNRRLGDKGSFSSLPTSFGDSSLLKLFRFYVIPHHVWIDTSGKIIAMTNGYNATHEHITAILNGEKVDMAVKDQDPGSRYLSEDGKVFRTTSKYVTPVLWSGFTSYADNISWGGTEKHTDTATQTYRVTFVNADLASFYRYAYSGNYTKEWMLNESKFTFTCRDSNNLDKWERENYYCYEVYLPVALRDSAAKWLRDDLNRLTACRYGITGKMEKREVSCYVITQTKKSLLKTKNVHDFSSSERALLDLKNEFSYQNFRMSTIVEHLKEQTRKADEPVYILDETGLSDDQFISITLPKIKNGDVLSVRSALQVYGLDIVLAKRTLDLLVISDL